MRTAKMLHRHVWANVQGHEVKLPEARSYIMLLCTAVKPTLNISREGLTGNTTTSTLVTYSEMGETSCVRHPGLP